MHHCMWTYSNILCLINHYLNRCPHFLSIFFSGGLNPYDNLLIFFNKAGVAGFTQVKLALLNLCVVCVVLNSQKSPLPNFMVITESSESWCILVGMAMLSPWHKLLQVRYKYAKYKFRVFWLNFYHSYLTFGKVSLNVKNNSASKTCATIWSCIHSFRVSLHCVISHSFTNASAGAKANISVPEPLKSKYLRGTNSEPPWEREIPPLSELAIGAFRLSDSRALARISQTKCQSLRCLLGR